MVGQGIFLSDRLFYALHNLNQSVDNTLAMYKNRSLSDLFGVSHCQKETADPRLVPDFFVT